MADNQSFSRITAGMDVVGSDGEKLAIVDRLEGDYVVALKGMFFTTDYYIPIDAISNIDEDRVHLTMSRDIALDQGWETKPTEMSTLASSFDDAAMTGVADGGVSSASDSVSLNPDTAPFEHRSQVQHSHVHNPDTISVPLSEEELIVTTRDVDLGTVQIEKLVVEEERTLEVPVTEERVNVTRRAVDRAVLPEEAAFVNDTIDVPVRGQDVDIHKQARVHEEIEISKEAVTETRDVTETVRHEEAHVTGDAETLSGSVSVGDLDTSRGRKKKDS